MTTLRPAVFLDRDGTLMQDVGYPKDPRKVFLIDGAVEGLRRLADAGFALVTVSNQSGIARGILTVADYEAVQAEFERQLGEHGVRLTGAYQCPVAPPSGAPEDHERVDHEDRKPGPGMLRRAAREHGLSLPDSWMVGDRLSDVLAGRNAGCRGGLLVMTGKPITEAHRSHPAVACCVRGMVEAADYILRMSRSRTP